MSRATIRTPDALASPLFSQGVAAGGLLYTSGMAGLDAATGQLLVSIRTTAAPSHQG
jgi:2-iminobutanoate/2-iminopropanoate deaminase